MEHGRAYDLPFDPNNPQRLGRMQVEEVGRKELRCTISFVVPSATREWVGTLLSRAGIPPIGLRRSRYRADQWNFSTLTQERGIPHWVAVPGKINQELLVQVQGRLIECRYCGQVEHRTYSCPHKQQTTRQSYAAMVDRQAMEERARKMLQQEKEKEQKRIELEEKKKKVDTEITVGRSLDRYDR